MQTRESPCDNTQLAFEAAAAAFDIAASFESSAPIVLKTSELPDAQQAAQIALDVYGSHFNSALDPTITLHASTGIHGTHVELDGVRWPEFGYQRLIVNLTSTLPIPDNALPAILAEIKQQIDDAAEKTSTCIEQVVYVVDNSGGRRLTPPHEPPGHTL